MVLALGHTGMRDPSKKEGTLRQGACSKGFQRGSQRMSRRLKLSTSTKGSWLLTTSKTRRLFPYFDLSKAYVCTRYPAYGSDLKANYIHHICLKQGCQRVKMHYPTTARLSLPVAVYLPMVSLPRWFLDRRLLSPAPPSPSPHMLLLLLLISHAMFVYLPG